MNGTSCQSPAYSNHASGQFQTERMDGNDRRDPVHRGSLSLSLLGTNVISRARNSFGFTSANAFVISVVCLRKIGAIDETRNAQSPLNFPHTYQISVYNLPRFNDLRICTPVCLVVEFSECDKSSQLNHLRNASSCLPEFHSEVGDKLKKIRKILLVGAPGFEPGTSCAQGSGRSAI